jgi:predicted DNA-binding protein YlxM (UPF0122 family)
MNRIPPDLLLLIKRQKELRRKIVSWRVIAEMSGVSKRAVYRAIKRV